MIEIERSIEEVTLNLFQNRAAYFEEANVNCDIQSRCLIQYFAFAIDKSG